jgi:hypothetical protein
MHGISFAKGGNKGDGENRASGIANSPLTPFAPVPSILVSAQFTLPKMEVVLEELLRAAIQPQNDIGGRP